MISSFIEKERRVLYESPCEDGNVVLQTRNVVVCGDTDDGIELLQHRASLRGTKQSLRRTVNEAVL
jgi:hypothetical protein